MRPDTNSPSTIPAELLSPSAAPPGYETCWGFLARTELATVSLQMLDPIAGLAADELKARRIAKAMRLPFMVLPAPMSLKAAEGLTEIGAYPTSLLEWVFP
jgi:hypothetical protein